MLLKYKLFFRILSEYQIYAISSMNSILGFKSFQEFSKNFPGGNLINIAKLQAQN